MTQIPLDKLNWRPARNSQTPLHDQIVAWVKGQVASGEWPRGSRLPTQRDLAEALGVNRSTLVAALARLTNYGIIEGKGAAGTYVASNSWSILLADRTNRNRRSNAPALNTNAPLVDAIRKRAQDVSTICLGSGALDAELFPMQSWHEAMESMSTVVDTKSMEETLGLEELRRALARRASSKGADISVDQVLITNGNLQSMRLICQGLLEPGSDLLVARPTYAKGLTILPEAGIHVVEVASDEEGLVPEALADQARHAHPGSVLYCMPTNQNPTGRTMGQERRIELVKTLEELRMPVIEDGSFDELSWAADPRRLKALDPNNTIYMGCASKSYAPGLRVGWIAAPATIISSLAEIKRITDYGDATPSQMMMCQLLESGTYDRHLTELRLALRERSEAAMAALERHMAPYATWTEPTGGYFVWITFKAPLPKEQLFTESLHAGVMLNLHDMFDHRHNDSVRLSFAAVDTDKFEEGVQRMAEIVRKLA